MKFTEKRPLYAYTVYACTMNNHLNNSQIYIYIYIYVCTHICIYLSVCIYIYIYKTHTISGWPSPRRGCRGSGCASEGRCSPRTPAPARAQRLQRASAHVYLCSSPKRGILPKGHLKVTFESLKSVVFSWSSLFGSPSGGRRPKARLPSGLLGGALGVDVARRLRHPRRFYEYSRWSKRTWNTRDRRALYLFVEGTSWSDNKVSLEGIQPHCSTAR